MIQEYFKPASVEEALAIQKDTPGSIWYGGGTDINYPPSGKESTCVISLENLGLDAVAMDGQTLVVGSMVTIQDLIDSPVPGAAVREAAAGIYSRNIRNIATVGGNLGAKRRDSALIPCLVALSAQVETADEGMLPVEEYVLGNHDSLIRAVHVPPSPGVCCLRKLSRSAGSEPFFHAAVYLDGTWGSVQEAVIAVGGIAPSGTRLKEVETGLKKGTVAGQEELEAAVAEAVNPESDLHGSAAYKRYIAGVAVADCVAECVAEYTGAGR